MVEEAAVGEFEFEAEDAEGAQGEEGADLFEGLGEALPELAPAVGAVRARANARGVAGLQSPPPPDPPPVQVSGLDGALEAALRDPAATSSAVGSLEEIHTQLFDQVLGTRLPLIGSELGRILGSDDDLFGQATAALNLAFAELSSIPDDVAISEADLRTAMFNAFDAFGLLPGISGPNGLRLRLGTGNGDLMLLELDIHGTLFSANVQPRFDLGLPSLRLDLGDVSVQLSATYDLHLKLGLDNQGFFLETGAPNAPPGSPPEIQVNLSVSLQGLDATGTLAFLQLHASDNGTRFDSTITVDIRDGPDADTKLRPSELADLSLAARLTGQANVKLHLAVNFAGSAVFPSLKTDFNLRWDMPSVNLGPNLDLENFGSAPTLGFSGVKLDMGSFFGDFLQPIAVKINTVLGPIKPVLDVLTARLPLFSDIPLLRMNFDNNGDGLVSVADIIGRLGNADLSFLGAVADLATFASFLGQMNASGEIDLGGFDLGGAGSGIDLRSLPDLGGISLPTLPNSNVLDQFLASNDLNVRNFGSRYYPGATGGDHVDFGGGGATGLTLQILTDPSIAFGLLLGKTGDLLHLDLPPLGASVRIGAFFPLLGPLGVRLEGRLGLALKFAFGYDTEGLQEFATSLEGGNPDPSLIFDGFYVDDQVNEDGDVPELSLSASILAAGALDALVVEAGVGGGVRADVEFDLHDESGDGKVRVRELLDSLEEGPLCLFDVHGELTAGLEAYVRVGVYPFDWEASYEIATVTLLEFNSVCGHSEGGMPPILATRVDRDLNPRADGEVLRLNMGPYAGNRGAFSFNHTDGDEFFRVEHVSTNTANGTETVLVSGFGVSETFSGIRKIYAEGGGGSPPEPRFGPITDGVTELSRNLNDVIIVDEAVVSEVELWGDFNPGRHPDQANRGGNDNLFAGSGPAVLHGGPGDDQLTARNTGARLYGDAGNDLLLGGDGDDTLEGGPGNDRLRGGGGADRLFGGDGDDDLEGGSGIDTLEGGAGNDLLKGGDGDDTLRGDAGSDLLVGEAGNDTLDGGADDDSLAGDDAYLKVTSGVAELVFATSGVGGNDTLMGGGGNDQLKGQGGDDVLEGGAGDDTLEGSVGADKLYGGDGNDWLFGGAGNDELEGDAGADRLEGGNGNDQLFGGTGDDTLLGEAGSDLLVGGAGDDVLDGGLGDDSLAGDDAQIEDSSGVARLVLSASNVGGADHLLGGDGADLLYGQGGDDVLEGGAGNDTLFGGAGNDLLEGGAGADVLEGEAGDDFLYGHAANGAGDDAASDQLYGGAGRDTLYGGDGPDWLYGFHVNAAGDDATGDTLYGEGGDDFLCGQGGGDLIYGGAGIDLIMGGPGADTLYGDDGDDRIFGFTDTAEGDASDTDVIFGGAGLDTIHGNAGADEIHGGTGDDWLYGDGGSDRIFGDEGNDHIWGGWEDEALSLADGGGDALLSGGDGDDEVYGEAGHDVIEGNDGNDLLYGGTGDDRISGNNGDDMIWGNEGNDTIFGNNGDDVIWGNEGDDRIEGGAGNDRIYGGLGDDTIAGNEGDDVIRGEGGNDTITGDAGDDVIYGEAGDDVLAGGAGQDRIYGGDGNDVIYGFAADPAGDDGSTDSLYGEAGADTLWGGRGDDRLDGGPDADELHGGAGNDLLIADSGIGDRLYGQDGDDRLFGSDDGSDVDPDFTDGIRFGDYLDGGAGDDMIWGLGGADEILGGPGNDYIDSGRGADLVRGGDGDDWVFAGRGLGDTIYGDAGDDTLYGSHEGNDVMFGGPGRDRLFGQGGVDELHGGLDDDYLNGGIGADRIFGDEGYDELDGGGGAGDFLSGGEDADVLYGSDDGGDTLHGDQGDDILLGRGGNDTLEGGPGNDRLEGGPGDDTLAGGDGSDVLLGQANHDTLYGNSPTNLGAADEVDYLYGDFGTNGNEAGSGNDRLFGQAGNDFLFGEGGDDFLDAGTGAGNVADYGAGESANPQDFTPGPATPSPQLATAANLINAEATLPQGSADPGRWSEWMGSATGLGLSGDPGLSIEPTVAVAGSGAVFVAWTDLRYGNYEIYLARYTSDAGWQSLGGSAGGGGLSNTPGSSRRPSVAVDGAGNPVVAWTESAAGRSDIRAARWDPGSSSWVSLGTTVSTSGAADAPVLIVWQGAPVVAWLDRGAGAARVYAARFNGAAWEALAGSNSGSGISGGGVEAGDVALAGDANALAAAWSATTGGQREVYLKEFRNGQWRELGGSASGGGVSGNTGLSLHPTVAYHGGLPFVAWDDDTSSFFEVYAVRWDGAVWREAGSGAATDDGVSATHGRAGTPRLAAGGSELDLLWVDDRLQNHTAHDLVVYVRRWDGVSFIEPVLGDASHRGISLTGELAAQPAAAVDAQGRPVVVWTDTSGIGREVFLRADGLRQAGAVLTADETRSVQQLLDANDLGPGDVIYVQGEQASGFALGPNDDGVLIYGLPGATVNGPVVLTGAGNSTVQRLRLEGGLAISNSTQVTVRESDIRGEGLVVNGGAQVRLAHNSVGAEVAVTLRGGVSNAIVEFNNIEGTTTALALAAGGANGLVARENRLAGGGDGVLLAAASSGQLSSNDIHPTGTGVVIAAPFTGLIAHNNIHGAAAGVNYAAAATLSGNRIHGNSTGVLASSNTRNEALGFVGAAEPNEIFDNATGVRLTGWMQNQHVFANTTGVNGSGVLGPVEGFDLANVFEHNVTGADFAGVIQFNRFLGNETAIEARAGQQVWHNVFARNTRAGLHAAGASGLQVLQNTFYAATGDNIRIEGGAANVELLNNTLWAEGGYDLFVANDSRSGFFSDYNDLYASRAGRPVWWAVDFTDILDWQADVARFDLNSVGSTVVDPGRARPRFLSLARDDYRVFDMAAGQRATSLTVDAGASFIDRALPLAGPANLLTNPSFEAGLAGWTTNPEAVTNNTWSTPYDAGHYFHGGPVAVASAEQTLSLLQAGFSAAQLDSKDYAVVFGGRIRAGIERDEDGNPALPDDAVADEGTLTLSFLNAAGQVLDAPTVLHALNTSDRWELVGARVQVPFGARSVRYRFEALTRSGMSNDSLLDGALLFVLRDTVAPDLGAYGNTPLDSTPAGPGHLVLRTPDLYVDWERDLPHEITWASFGNDADSLVRVDLMQDAADGPRLLANLAAATDDDGRFTWIPANSSIAYGTKGLRVQLRLVDQPLVVDRSAEPFSVPENTNSYFANDAVVSGDEYTTAAGSNRATGRLADAPKPNPVNVLRVYALGPGQTLFVDTGDYRLHYPVRISNTLGLGNDEGFTLTGPAAAGRTAQLQPANPLDIAPVLELDNADLMTLSHLTVEGGSYGLLVRHQSTGFRGTDLSFAHHALDGVRLDSGSAAVELSGVRSVGNGGDAFHLEGVVTLLTGAEARASGGRGVFIRTDAAALIVNTKALQNGSDGILAQGPVTVRRSVAAENRRQGDEGGAAAGLRLSDGGAAEVNVVFGNDLGIFAHDSLARANRVYGNAGPGIQATGQAVISGNVVYTNQSGLLLDGNFLGRADHNLVYDNRDAGVEVFSNVAPAIELVNNTIYQPAGNGVHVAVAANNVHLRNNIIWTMQGAGIVVDDEAQDGFSSDYNLLYATGAGKTGHWQGLDRPTLAAWQSAAFTDANSLSQNPLLVDADGAENLLGYRGLTQDGRDDDFHLQSPYGSFHGGSAAPVLDAATGLPVLPAATLTNDARQSAALDRGDAADGVGNEPAPNGGFVNLGFDGGTALASKSAAQYVLLLTPDGGETLPQRRDANIRWRSHDRTGTVTLELLRAGGTAAVLTIAASTENDGEFVWSVPDTLAAGDDYSLRVTRGGLSDTSNAPFAITAPITVYYVNDGTVQAGDWTTAPGNDANPGVLPSAPKASIRAVLEAYALGAGDVIRVDAGTYVLSANLLITQADAGVRIEGYHDARFPARSALLDRHNTAAGSYVVELRNADNVTLDNLQLTGANVGIYAAGDSDTQGLTVTACTIFGNQRAGIQLGPGNHRATLTGNDLRGPSASDPNVISLNGLELGGADALVSDNQVHGHADSGIRLTGDRSQVVGNHVYENQFAGILAAAEGPANLITISSNRVHGNGWLGIEGTGQVLLDANTVFDQGGAGDEGIHLVGAARATANVVYDNDIGILLSGNGVSAADNRVYHNTTVGLQADGRATLTGNRVYANGTGIGLGPGFDGVVRHNLIYTNTREGLRLEYLRGVQANLVVEQNTFHTAGGTAVRLEALLAGFDLRNNIFWIDGGAALFVAPESQIGFASDYNLFHLTGGGLLADWGGARFTQRSDWTLELGLDPHSLEGDPRFLDADGADNLLGYRAATRTDGGADDDFRLGADSPAIDRADPASYYLAEPAPNGGRADLGAFGNTAFAPAGAAQIVQVLAPAGLEKVVLGQNVNIQWQTYGIGSERTVALINAGGDTVDRWLAEAYRVGVGIAGHIDSSISLAGVTNPAPSAVYQDFVEAQSGAGRALTYELPVPNGDYSVRLHFIEPFDFGAGNRRFDILLQETVVASGVDVQALTGGIRRAMTRTFSATVGGGSGLRLQLLNRTDLPAILSAIEITAAVQPATAAPTADVEASLDGGASWRLVAGAVAADPRGLGQFTWTPDGESTGGGALVRVTANHGTRPRAVSAPFLVVNAGHDYYVNDAEVAPGDWTTAPGANTNGGKDTAHPMASLTAVLAAYRVGAGDVIHLDSGRYLVARNVVLDGSRSGLRVEGFLLAGSPGRRAVLDRGNAAAGNYLFVLESAGGVTLENLVLTGARTAIVASGQFDQPASIIGNDLYGNQGSGADASAAGAGLEFRANTVHDNGGDGLVLAGAARAVENVVSGHAGSGRAGLRLAQGASARGNLVMGNYDGIVVEGATGVWSNRVFNQGHIGIVLGAGAIGEIVGNRLYDNPTGIALVTRDFRGWITNNLIYRNTTQGLLVSGSSFAAAEISNNTFQQSGSPAIVLEERSEGIALRNNIFAQAGGSALRVAADSEKGFSSDYNLFFLTGGGKTGQWAGQDYISPADWFYALDLDRHSFAADPRFIDPDGADNRLGFDRATGQDFGLDDDFHLRAGSPAIDAGDPASYSLAEPWPNGGRADLGAYGNTAETAASPAQVIQLDAPNGLERWEVGQTNTVLWRTAGFTASRAVARINVGGGAEAGWLADRYALGQPLAFTFTDAPGLAGVAAPAPGEVYQTARFAPSGIGKSLTYLLPVPDGSYTVRLHFADFDSNAAGQRRFDISLQGVVTVQSLDLFASTGGQRRALAAAFAVNASGGRGIRLDLVNRTDQPALLSGIEVTAANPSPVGGAAMNLDLSTDGGGSWTPVASGLPLDVEGQGRFLWTPPVALGGSTGLMRLRATTPAGLADLSDAPFLLVNGGRDYYVNDASVSPGDWTSAPGNNANHGKDPAHPVASLVSLFAFYDLDPNDVIHVDNGRYTFARNLALEAEDSGVRITGFYSASTSERAAILDRASTVAGSYLFEFVGASNVTLEALTLTGAETAVFAGNDSTSTGITVRQSRIFGNQETGVFLGEQVSGALVAGNTIYGVKGGSTLDDQRSGIVVHGAGAQVMDNTIYDHQGEGIWVDGACAVVRGNELYGNAVGLRAEGGQAGQTLVESNLVRANARTGIEATGNVRIASNSVFSHLTAGAVGIELGFGAVAVANDVYRNATGVVAGATSGDTARVERNRVFANEGSGIVLTARTVAVGNQVYSNAVGIEAGPLFQGGFLENVLYANTEEGLLVRGGTAEHPVAVLNNTVVQTTGVAVRLESEAERVRLRNNILTIESGYALDLTSNDAAMLDSDYNLFRKGGAANAHLVRAGGSDLDTLAAWQQASRLDGLSLVADPRFVDPDGADNVLGYRPANGGYDGGVDDNFILAGGSPAIDRGDSWAAPATDALGAARRDDPGTANLGAPDYLAREQTGSLFTVAGQAQNWHSDAGFLRVALPFAFSFYGQTYTEVFASPAGFIDFDEAGNDGSSNSTSALASHRRIAPLWADLGTSASGRDLFVQTSVAGQVTIRWNAARRTDGASAAFAVTLFNDGRLRFDYGGGNAVGPATVGLSSGDGEHFLVSAYSGRASLGNANSIEILLTRETSLPDLGAYEFAGSSLDHAAPAITATTPSPVHAGGSVVAGARQIEISLSEAPNPIDANAPANYELRRDGGDGIFGNADDLVFELEPDHLPGSAGVTLRLRELDLFPGRYRLQVSLNGGLRDLAGNALDGDADGAPGGAYVRVFQVIPAAPEVVEFLVQDGARQRSLITSLSVTFNVEVGASLAAGDFELVNRSTGARVQLGADALAYDPAAHRATLSFAGLPGARLADGRYQLTIPASAVASAENVPMAGPFAATFAVLTGDATGDAVTNDLDLYRVWQNLLKPAFARDLNDDLNGDGQVTAEDLAVVKGNYLAALPPLPSPSLAPALPPAGLARLLAQAVALPPAAPLPSPLVVAPAAGSAAHTTPTAVPALVPALVLRALDAGAAGGSSAWAANTGLSCARTDASFARGHDGSPAREPLATLRPFERTERFLCPVVLHLLDDARGPGLQHSALAEDEPE